MPTRLTLEDNSQKELTKDELLEKASGEAEDAGFLSGIDVPALFAADLEDEVIEFTVGKCPQPSTVTLKPMNADKMARYRDALSKFSQVEGQSDRFYYEVETAEADLLLLLGSVVGLSVNSLRKDTQGGEFTQTTNLPPAGRAREEFFRNLHPDFRGRLVREAKRVNGLHPKSQG